MRPRDQGEHDSAVHRRAALRLRYLPCARPCRHIS
jgi:hypothetical protein